jgi:phenylacetate-CoA ligase
MSTADMDRFISDIRAFRPTMLYGYPSSMTLIAQRAEKRAVRLDDLGTRVAFCTAEQLYPHQADVLRRVFGCPVADGYGGRDSGLIAHDCPKGRSHITAEGIVVEIVDERGQPLPPGRPGDVVVTHLANTGFPFIRYRMAMLPCWTRAVCLWARVAAAERGAAQQRPIARRRRQHGARCGNRHGVAQHGA